MFEVAPTVLLGLAMIPFAAALAIAVVGRSTLNSLRLLVVVMPLSAFGAVEAGFTIPWSYLVLLAILAGMLLRGEFISTRYTGCKPIVLYWSIALLATLVGILGPEIATTQLGENMRLRAGPMRSPLQLALLVFHFGVFFLVVNYVKEQTQATKLLKTHLWVGFALFCVGLYQIAAYVLQLPIQDITWSIDLLRDSATTTYGTVRLYSAKVAGFSTRATFFESLNFADYLNSVLPIAVALWMSGSKEIRRQFGFLATPTMSIMGMLALFFTMSRSGWAGFAVAMVVLMIWLSPRRAVIHLPIAAAAMSLVAALLVKLGFFSSSATSLTEIISGRFDMEEILMGPRAQYFMLLWESFKSNPILGLGAGKFAVAAPAATGSAAVHSAHGLLWAALADFGLLGFLSLAFVFAAVLLRLRKAIRESGKKSPEQVIMIGLFASLCGLLVQSLFVGDRPQFYLVFLLGMAAVYSGWFISGRRKADAVLPETPDGAINPPGDDHGECR